MLNDLISLFYPNNCVCCKRPLSKGETDCCLICFSELPRTNYYKYPENPVAKLFWGRIELTYGFSTYHFTKRGKIQTLMHELKYRNKTNIGVFLGREIGKEISQIDHQLDYIIPVPLHPKKQQLRGYNQSTFIATGISEILKIPYSETILIRNTDTSSQTRKSKYERWENVSEIFSVTSQKEVNGKNFLLVDDVITTGSTLESCAHQLLSKGANSVAIAVIASGF